MAILPLRSVIPILAVVLAAQTAWCQEKPVGSIGSYQEAFDIVWRTVNDYYFDPHFGGVDWNAARDKYRPRALAAKTDDEYYQALQDMLGELGASHFAIVPPEAAVEAGDTGQKGGTAGVRLHLVDGAMLVTYVTPGSAAERAGVRPGFEVVRAGDDDVAGILDRLSKVRGHKNMVPLMADRAVAGRLDGEAETEASAVFRVAGGAEKTIRWRRAPHQGVLSEPFGNLPATWTEVESRELPGGIGYIRFNIFLMPVMEKVRAAVEQFRDANGLVIDLRGNPGGLALMASGMAGLWMPKQCTLGRGQMRQGYINLAVFPVPKPVTIPLAILVDSSSTSTSEILAAAMQELGRAVVVGERTAGAALASSLVKLPTGALFQFVQSDFHTPGNQRIEGRGVTPDIAVSLTQPSLLAGHDAQLEAAEEAIRRAGRNHPQTKEETKQ